MNDATIIIPTTTVNAVINSCIGGL